MKLALALAAAVLVLPWTAAGAATSAPSFGGYRTSSSAAGIELLYNDGREVDLTIPSATTSATTGSGHALAAPLYPGSVGGNPGATIKQFLGSHLPAQLADALGQLNDPLKAEAYASGPNDASFPPGGGPAVLTDTAHVDPDGAHMKAAGTFVDAGGLTSSAVSTTDITSAGVTSTATATISDLNVAGLIHLGQVTSVAKATTDGTVGKPEGSTKIAALTIAGMSLAVDPTSLAVGPAKVPLNLTGLLNPLLKALGIQLAVSPETHNVTGAKAIEHAPALTINIAPPNNGGNTFLLTVGGAVAEAQANAPFSPPSDAASTVPPSGSGLSGSSAGSTDTSSPSASSSTPVTGANPSDTSAATLPPAEAIANVPISTQKSKSVPLGLVVLR